AATAGASGAGVGVGEGGGTTRVRKREIGGRMSRFTMTSPSVRFGFGFFSSISETVSTARGAVGAGLGASADLAGVSGRGLAGASTRGLAGGSTCALGAG